MLKNYQIGAYIYQYEEGTQPDGAKEYKPDAKPAEAKASAEKAEKAPANKAKKAVANK